MRGHKNPLDQYNIDTMRHRLSGKAGECIRSAHSIVLLMFSNNENDQISLVPLHFLCQAKFVVVSAKQP
jgi:hypothetical protein